LAGASEQQGEGARRQVASRIFLTSHANVKEKDFA
jgi:hypothetical protein